MLIDFNTLVEKYNMDISGILHIGAHECEELNDYLHQVPKNRIVWLEGNPELVNNAKQRDPDIIIYHAIVTDRDDNEITLKITNNGQSSSILDFGEHMRDYPWCKFVDSYSGKSCTVRSIYNKYGIDDNFANFLNIDIQGAELLALKGMGDLLIYFDYLYLEINVVEMYKGCALVQELDEYLLKYHFHRVETSMAGGWGDALYIKRIPRISSNSFQFLQPYHSELDCEQYYQAMKNKYGLTQKPVLNLPENKINMLDFNIGNELNNYAKTVYSQWGEDGILEEIFNRIGTTNRFYVEFGGWDGKYLSNTYNLKVNHGWSGLLLEGSQAKVNSIPESERQNLNLHYAWVSSKNVNQLFQQHNVPKEFDLLSIDIDSDDFHVWKAVSYRPRVVIIEYHPGIDQNFHPLIIEEGQCQIHTGGPMSHAPDGRLNGYFGANLRAMYELGKVKGYELVSTVNVNAIFVRKDEFEKLAIEKITPEQCAKNFFVPQLSWYIDRDKYDRQWLTNI